MVPNILLIGGNGRLGKIHAWALEDLEIPFTIATRQNYRKLIDSGDFQGAIIATPASTHLSIAEECLKQSLPVLIEKPLGLSANEIFPLYPYQDFPILINHLQLFNSAFQETLKQLKNKQIVEINSLGFGFGPFRSDCSPLLDYCHDFSMSLYLSKTIPKIEFIEEFSTNTGKIYHIGLNYLDFLHSMVIGNGADHNARFLEIKCDDGTVFQINGLSDHKLIINDLPFLELDKTGSMENLIQNFINGIANGQYDDRWGLDLGRKVVKLANDCEQKLINNFAS